MLFEREMLDCIKVFLRGKGRVVLDFCILWGILWDN
jgi:hypothetical protein